MFVEQYLFGRSKRHAHRTKLGGEYPVLMYRSDDREHDVYRDLLVSSFDAVWSSLSYPAQLAASMNEEEEFQKNYERLAKYFDVFDDGFHAPATGSFDAVEQPTLHEEGVRFDRSEGKEPE